MKAAPCGALRKVAGQRERLDQTGRAGAYLWERRESSGSLPAGAERAAGSYRRERREAGTYLQEWRERPQRREVTSGGGESGGSIPAGAKSGP